MILSLALVGPLSLVTGSAGPFLFGLHDETLLLGVYLLEAIVCTYLALRAAPLHPRRLRYAATFLISFFVSGFALYVLFAFLGMTLAWHV